MTETASPNPGSLPAATTTPRVADLHVITTKRRSLLSDAWFRLVRNKASMAGLVVIILFFIIALLANVIAPNNPLKMNSGKSYLPPVWISVGAAGEAPDPQFVMGTDNLGRDVLSRVLYGARV